MFKFFFSKVFFINIILALLFFCIVIWGVFKFINSYTLHGETIAVPSLKGLSISEMNHLLTENNLQFKILDSVYVESMKKGVVLYQNPAANDLVKENRTIYITTTKKIPPEEMVPYVVDMSERAAISKLKSAGFEIKISYTPHKSNFVLKQQIKGREIMIGEEIKARKGSVIELFVGSNSSNEEVSIPYLLYSTKEEAMAVLEASFLTIGVVNYKDCYTTEDSLNATVYQQSPSENETEMITVGSPIDLWLTGDSEKKNEDPLLKNG